MIYVCITMMIIYLCIPIYLYVLQENSTLLLLLIFRYILQYTYSNYIKLEIKMLQVQLPFSHFFFAHDTFVFSSSVIDIFSILYLCFVYIYILYVLYNYNVFHLYIIYLIIYSFLYLFCW